MVTTSNGPTAATTCGLSEILDRVADKWSLHVIAVLAGDELRFSEIRRRIDGISQRMLTVTLRELERDGIVHRTVHSAMPPNIAYRLTPMGATLWDAATPIVAWARAHLPAIDSSRRRYDAAHTCAMPAPVPRDALGHR